jgi:F0F1-type ATP synthase membrane subunit c/vacuolar-type H+-ATPase subunit K
MNFSLNQVIKTLTISAIAITPIVSTINPAAAAPKYMSQSISQSSTVVTAPQSIGTQASYLGAGIAGGLTSDSASGAQAKSGGSLYGRYAIPQTKLSARGGVVFTDKISAVTPKLTYDVGVAPGTNLFFGAGYNFVNEQTASTPLGNKSAPVLSLGVESELANNVLVFGSADLGVNAYQNNNNTAVALQGGAGFRF